MSVPCSTPWVWWAMFNLHVNLTALRIPRDACPLGVSIRVFPDRFNCGSHHLVDWVSQTKQKGTLAMHQHPVYSRLQKQCDRLPQLLLLCLPCYDEPYPHHEPKETLPSLHCLCPHFVMVTRKVIIQACIIYFENNFFYPLFFYESLASHVFKHRSPLR